MDAMEFAEDLSPLFLSRITDSAGNEARYMSVQTIEFTKNVQKNVAEYQLNIHYLSDQGDLYPSLRIREFGDIETLETELDGYNKFVELCELFDDITAYSLLTVDQKKGMLIFEHATGFTLDRLGISQQLRYFILGRIYGTLHGKSIEQLDDENFHRFFSFLLQHLPFTDEEKKSMLTLIERELLKFKQNFGGFTPHVSINPDDIIIHINDSINNLTREIISQGVNLSVSIKFERPDELAFDRMGDMADLFHDRAYSEFIDSNKLIHTKYAMNEFLDGYILALEKLELPTLKEMYPLGTTIHLQLLFVAWLKEVEKLQIGQLDPHTDRELLRYSYYLLTENPFSDLI
ncbi:MAG: hypothetical protein HeimC2_00680 [Candidatus Heimdallarchaeota archaeon LC_2]|nr:MAG: hypothetical protein HeimC2_00680 [Candidatus Heimdallarchaeota archaeon LC_2]